MAAMDTTTPDRHSRLKRKRVPSAKLALAEFDNAERQRDKSEAKARIAERLQTMSDLMVRMAVQEQAEDREERRCDEEKDGDEEESQTMGVESNTVEEEEEKKYTAFVADCDEMISD